jgi:hypothetical protein
MELLKNKPTRLLNSCVTLADIFAGRDILGAPVPITGSRRSLYKNAVMDMRRVATSGKHD